MGKDRSNFLIIDDKQIMLSLISRMLKNNGYDNFTVANSAVTAIKKLTKERSINFIITDWNMPNMNGIELLTYIRKKNQYADMPVMMISEELTDNKILYAVGEGVDGYLEKPFSEKELITVINHVLQSKLQPDPMKYQIQKIHSLRLQRKYTQAIEFAESILAKDFNDDVLVVLGQCYLNKRQYDDAENTILKALKIKETYKAYHLLGQIYMAKGEYKEAIEYLEKAYAINPLGKDAVIDMGKAYLNMGLTKEATEVFGSLQDNTLTDLNCTSIGSAYLGVGDIISAGTYLGDIRAPMMETIGIFNKYAIELRKSGQIREAIEQYEKCLKIEPDNHIILLNAAASHVKLKNYKEAKKLLVKCLKIDPNYENAHKLLAAIAPNC